MTLEQIREQLDQLHRAALALREEVGDPADYLAALISHAEDQAVYMLEQA